MGFLALFAAAAAVLSAVRGVDALPTSSNRTVSIMDLTPKYPYDPNTHPGCTFWWNNDGDLPCMSLVGLNGFGITLEDLVAWNPSLTPECGNFITGRSYCVEVRGWVPPVTSTSGGGGPSPTQTSGGIVTSLPAQPDMVDNCEKFHFVERGHSCSSITKEYQISLPQLVAWNPSIQDDCSNLWLNVWVCVGTIGFEAPPPASTTKPPASTTTAPSNGVETKQPIQPGMVDNCASFHFVASGSTCASITKEYGISLQQFVAWNPTVYDDCSGLWANVYVCIKTIGFQAPTSTTKAPSTSTSPGNGVKTEQPIQPGMVTNCNKFHLVKTTTTCQGIVDYNKITLADFLKWNPSVGSNCESLWLDHYTCVGVIGGSTVPSSTSKPPTTTTAPSNGVETKQPIQPGMVGNCNKFHLVKTTTTCQGIVDYNKITLADFLKWNPSVGSNCESLWLDHYTCVGVIGGSTVPSSTSKPPTTTTAPSNGVKTEEPIQPGMVTNCNKFHLVKTTTTCQGIVDYNKITMADFLKWNPLVGSNCGNLWLDHYTCVGVIGGSQPPPSTTTKLPANGIATPSPIQSGMVSNCNKFHPIQSTTTCPNLLSYNGITMAELFKWNPAVKSDCSGLLAGTHACVGVIGGSQPPPSTTTKLPANGIATPSPIQSGMVSNCNKFHPIQSTTTCPNLLSYNGITMAELFKWNPAVKSDCSGLLAGTHACVGVIGQSPKPTTTQGSGGIPTPTSIQPGMTKGCTKFHPVQATTTCQGILNYHGITLAQFVKWNPAVGKDCSNLWAGTSACVAGP